jgi:hypothetical protein
MIKILKKQVLCLLICVLLGIHVFAVCSTAITASEPSIKLLNIPAYGSRIENLTGVILGGIANDYQLGVYIFVDGWRTKQVEKINNDGYWICDITTQNNDWAATHIAVFLLTKDSDLPILNNDKVIPTALFDKALYYDEIVRKPMINSR